MSAIVLEVHPSDVNSALLCEYRLREDLWDRMPRRDLTRGSITHHFIESHLLDMPPDAEGFLKDMFTEEYGYQLGEVVPEVAIERVIEEGRLASVLWLAQVRPSLKLKPGAFAVEKEYRIPIYPAIVVDQTEYQIVLVGSPDLVDSDTVIHDWKSAARAWDLIKPTWQMQPPLYSHLVFGTPTPFQFWIMVFGGAEPHWEAAQPILPTFSQMHEALNFAARLALKRELMLLTPNPGPGGVYMKVRHWHCSPKYCNNWDACPGKSLFNDGSDDIKRDWEEEWLLT